MTTSAPKYARVRIAAAEQFLTWLENNDIALADATQRDVNTWLGLGATTRHRLRDFLSWAHARGPTADLEVHWLAAMAWPSSYSATTSAGYCCGDAYVTMLFP
jgi:hypothetical protein